MTRQQLHDAATARVAAIPGTTYLAAVQHFEATQGEAARPGSELQQDRQQLHEAAMANMRKYPGTSYVEAVKRAQGEVPA